jgi:hypothetical protein
MKVEYFFFGIESSITILWTMPIVPCISPNLGYKISIRMTFIPLYNFKNGYKLLVLKL